MFYLVQPFFAALTLSLILAGCASQPDPRVQTEDKFGIEYALHPNGSPTIVFENGLGATSNEWDKVVVPLSQKATVFTYNRPGYGESKPANTQRDAEHIVGELRALLLSKGLKPPYILVGHSLGGLYMQYFARRYPGEVRGVVLVDSTHPNQFEGKGSYENWPAWYRGFFQIAASETTKEELSNVRKSGQEVLALQTPRMPIVILSAKESSDLYKDLSDDANAKRVDLLRLYPSAKQIWVESGHMIPLEKPQTIIDAVWMVVQK